MRLDAGFHPDVLLECSGVASVASEGIRSVGRAGRVVLVGMGGVRSGRDALELIACGATDVALGTILFADPDAPARVRAELEEEATRAGFDTPDAAFCAALSDVVKLAN